jgi:tyrosine-specific transport protein
MALSTRVKSPSLVGGILLIVGNVIGAGILALPIATAQLGLGLALLVLVAFWALMLFGAAFYFLEANLALPAGTNLVSMARASLGSKGAGVAWICNLFVLYSLIAAYMAGGGDLIGINLQRAGLVAASSTLGPLLFLLFFGGIVTLGMARIDYVNRLLMFFKACVFLSVLFGFSQHLTLKYVLLLPSQNLSPSLIIIVLTSYGFACIIPSLRSYYHSDVKKIKKMICWGMGIALLCYLLWVTLIFCVIPPQGAYGLHHMANSSHPVSDLQRALNHTLHLTWITQAINIFSGICIMTSFLTNSVSLVDFISDGLSGYKRRGKQLLVYLMAYAPPFAAVLFYPRAFLLGLSMAGMFAIVLMLILPALMVWRFRYLAGQGWVRGQYGVILILSIGIFLLLWSVGGSV